MIATSKPAAGPPSASRTPWRTILAVVVTLIAWASAFVVIRFVAPHFSPGSLTLGRLIIGVAALSVLMLRHRLVAMTRGDWARVIMIGVAWFAIYNLALNAGEHYVDAGTASMLIQLAPILVAVLAGTVLKEGFPRMLVVGSGIAFTGTLLIGFATSRGTSQLVGVLLVLLAAVMYAGSVVVQKSVLRRVPAMQITWLACLIGAVVCLPFTPGLLTELARAPLSASLWVLYLGVVPTAVAFSTWAYALSRTSAGRLSNTTFAVPPVAIALSWVFLGERPAWLAVIGGLICLIGVALAGRRHV